MQNKEQIRQQMLTMIADWQCSGLSQKQYCVVHSIRYHIFHYWYKRFKDQTSADSSASFIAIPAAPVAVSGHIELFLAEGKRIVFHQPVSADFLKALIA